MAPLLAALVLHTQMAKLAVWPALTSLELEKDSIRTQSRGVFWVLCGGGDVVELGVGDGAGDVLDGLGVGDAGLDELPVGDVEVLDAEGDCVFEAEALGVDEGEVLGDALAEAELLMLAEPLGEADFVVLVEPLGEADFVVRVEPLGEADAVLRVDLPADADADAESLALWLRGMCTAADSTAFFGIDEHTG